MKYLFLLLMIITNFSFGTDNFYKNKTAGWFWYMDPKEKIKTIKPIPPIDLAAQVDFEKEELDRILKIAIKQPTKENLINFIKLRNKIIDQSYNFGIRLQQTNLMYPELDQLKTYPVNQAANEIYKTEKRENLEKKIADLAKIYGLFYVFESRCPYCHAFAPTVKRFATKYGWSILPVTLDGIPITEFPEARKDNGIANKLNIRAIPALIMVEPKTGKIIPIATGMISEEDIIERIELLTRETQK